MTSRYHFASLWPDSDARLPAGLALVLLALLAAQAALTGDVELPPPGPLPRGVRLASVAPPPQVGVPDTVRRRAIFASSGGRPDSSGEPQAAADPIAGVTVAGMVRIGRAAYALVQRPGAPTRNLAVGGTIAGWTLVGLTDTVATFARGAQRMRLGLGARAAPPTPPAVADQL